MARKLIDVKQSISILQGWVVLYLCGYDKNSAKEYTYPAFD